MGIDALGAYRNAAFMAAPGKLNGPSASKGVDATLGESTTQVKPKTAYEKLDDYVKMTPAQRMRADLLKKMGLSEEDLANMSPEEREGVEAKLREIMQQQMQEVAQKQQYAPNPVGQRIDTLA